MAQHPTTVRAFFYYIKSGGKSCMGNIRRTVENYFYIMKLMWHISKKRVICTGLKMSLSQYEYLFFHGYFLRKVLTFLETGRYPFMLR